MPCKGPEPPDPDDGVASKAPRISRTSLVTVRSTIGCPSVSPGGASVPVDACNVWCRGTAGVERQGGRERGQCGWARCGRQCLQARATHSRCMMRTVYDQRVLLKQTRRARPEARSVCVRARVWAKGAVNGSRRCGPRVETTILVGVRSQESKVAMGVQTVEKTISVSVQSEEGTVVVGGQRVE